MTTRLPSPSRRKARRPWGFVLAVVVEHRLSRDVGGGDFLFRDCSSPGRTVPVRLKVFFSERRERRLVNQPLSHVNHIARPRSILDTNFVIYLNLGKITQIPIKFAIITQIPK